MVAILHATFTTRKRRELPYILVFTCYQSPSSFCNEIYCRSGLHQKHEVRCNFESCFGCISWILYYDTRFNVQRRDIQSIVSFILIIRFKLTVVLTKVDANTDSF